MRSQRQPAQQFKRKHTEDQPGKRGQGKAGEEWASHASPGDEHADNGVVGQKGELQDSDLRWRRK